MMSEYTDIWDAVSAVLNGNPTRDERQRVEEWMAKDENNQLFFDKLGRLHYDEVIEEKAWDSKEHIYLKTRAKLKEHMLRSRIRFWQCVSVASVVLILILGGINLMYKETVPSVMVESKTPAGSMTTFTLSDGTTVALNASSSISYPLQFEGNSRTVKLDGEAYFEVAEDKKHPFIVEANQMKISVLGTSFNVKSYSDDKKIITTLLEGTVCVELNQADGPIDKSVMLMPGQQIIFDKTTKQIAINTVNPDLYASWKEGQCFFENERLVDIAKILERHFGVEITITSASLEDQLYSGFFSKKEGVLQLLNSFRKYRNFDYKLNDKGIEIYER